MSGNMSWYLRTRDGVRPATRRVRVAQIVQEADKAKTDLEIERLRLAQQIAEMQCPGSVQPPHC